MSDIPSYIFIRSDITAAPFTPIANNYHHHSGNATAVDSVSHQDLVAMKQMIQEISQDPSLLYAKCSIPQLSRSMTAKYQEWAANTAAAAAMAYQEQESNEHQSHDDDEAAAMHNNYNYNNIYDGIYHSNSLPQQQPMTPPESIKEKVFLPTTPQTQEMTTLSHHSSSLQQQHHSNTTIAQQPPPPPLFTMPYCQECSSNNSPLFTIPPPVSQDSSSLTHDGKDFVCDSLMSSAMGPTTTAAMVLEYPSMPMMARSA